MGKNCRCSSFPSTDCDGHEKFQTYVGVDNLTDQLPPYHLFGNGANDSIYDAIGRYLYAGARVSF